MDGEILNSKGFTLLEIMVALTIFAVGMLGIAGVQINSLRYNRESNTRTVTTVIAQGVMEQVLAMDDSNALFKVDSADMVWDLDPNSAATTISLPGSGVYSAIWSVDSNAPVSDVATISVTVSAATGRTVTLTNFRRFF